MVALLRQIRHTYIGKNVVKLKEGAHSYYRCCTFGAKLDTDCKMYLVSRAKLTAADDIIATLLILYISLLAHQHRSCIQWILADWEESIFQINVLHLIICSGLAHVTKACVCVCVFICVCVSVCLSACVSVCLYVCVSVFLCFCVSVWQCVCVGRCWMWKQMITCCSASGVWRFSQIQMISAHASRHLICAACYIRNVSTTSFLIWEKHFTDVKCWGQIGERKQTEIKRKRPGKACSQAGKCVGGVSA